MSRNAYTLFEKNIFLEMGGDTRFSSEMGEQQTIIRNGGGRVQKCRQKWGGESCAAKGRVKKGYPPQGVFCTYPYTLFI